MLNLLACIPSDFNPRSPHGERPAQCLLSSRFADFNPRSPHGERLHRISLHTAPRQFQPTLPARGATYPWTELSDSEIISTHAPRTGSDELPATSSKVQTHFNPRSPHGERHLHIQPLEAGDYFNPRSPHGERQFLPAIHQQYLAISTHAPRTGSDSTERLSD